MLVTAPPGSPRYTVRVPLSQLATATSLKPSPLKSPQSDPLGSMKVPKLCAMSNAFAGEVFERVHRVRVETWSGDVGESRRR